MIHVLFSSSAAGTLRQVLRSRGVADRVVDLTEWLDWGWISSERIEDRLRWFEESAGLDLDWLADCASNFLTEVSAESERLIWIAPRSAQDQCGLYWLLDKLEQPPGKMIVADFAFDGGWRDEPPLSLGELPDKFMAQLLDDCQKQEWNDSRFPRTRWRSLMDDGAVLRIVEGATVQSAPSNYFDETILGRCPPQWTKWSRVIGGSMCDASDAGHRVDDMFLRWRLELLIGSGAIEATDELPNWDAPTTSEPAKIRRAK